MLDLSSPLGPVVGSGAVALADELGVQSVGDLLRYYPRRYVDRGRLTDIAGLVVGEHITVVAQVKSAVLRDMRARRGKLLAVVIEDERGGELACTFFNGHKLLKFVTPGLRAMFSGKVGMFQNKPQLTHPLFEAIDPEDEIRPLIPVYPATAKLGSQAIARCVRAALDLIDEPRDPLPASLRKQESLADLGHSLRRIHLPESQADLQSARHRLVWDEAMGVQLALALRRRASAQRAAAACPPRPGGLLDAFDARLPFTLTDGQKRVGAEIAVDIAGRHPMTRLVQGDVGSGKTVVALRAMLQAVDAGRQAALLAPTEVLASQHARSLRALLGPLAQAGELGGAEGATRVTLLTGSLGAKARRQALLDAQSGEAGIVVGTHALLQDSVGFAELGLVVVDEQHRFGVEQRDALRARGGHMVPHMLVMTATPIPRTVAMTVYGDLETSQLTELPAGRSPIATTVVPLGEKPAWFGRVWQRVRDEVAAGHQAYVVCPRVGEPDATRAGTGQHVEDTDGEDPDDEPDEEAPTKRPPMAALEVVGRLLDGPLQGLRLGLLHGRLPPDEKDDVMRAFERGEIDVLVATTVVEVGVDVANATAMVVLDADRFGLSQLHQLRGRVGRGTAPGVCLLVTEAPAATVARERLDAVAATTDGFVLARVDLELRREGDVLGSLQSGRRSGLRLLSLLQHEDIIARSRTYATDLVEQDPGLRHHPGLADLVGQTVGDEERRAWLDRA